MAFFKLTIFRLNAAVISIGIATRTEKIPVDDTAIASGAPNFFKNNGTTAYTVWKAVPKPQKNSWIILNF